jgi:PhzF family phenazine biosynthesis protein
MTAIPYWHVDAFAARPFGGNQAAVMLLERWLPNEVLQAIAAENMFAETAFLVPDATGETDYGLRWFTPTSEVALCGHATLASGHVVLARGGGRRVRFSTRRAGVLEVEAEGDAYWLALPAGRVAPGRVPGLLEALGVDGLLFDAVSGVEQTAIVLLESEAAVRALEPDMAALARIDRMAICTAPGERTDVVSRVFVPAWGVPEDSVTGSAHAVLAPFWCERLRQGRLSAYQASARGGELMMEHVGEQVRLRGHCVTVVEGTFYLTG